MNNLQFLSRKYIYYRKKDYSKVVIKGRLWPTRGSSIKEISEVGVKVLKKDRKENHCKYKNYST